MNSENTLPISLQEVCTARWSKMRQELKTDPEYESIIPTHLPGQSAVTGSNSPRH